MAGPAPSRLRAAPEASAARLEGDALLSVLAFVSPRDIVRCAAVCRAWRSLVESAPWQLWHAALAHLQQRQRLHAGAGSGAPAGVDFAETAPGVAARASPDCPAQPDISSTRARAAELWPAVGSGPGRPLQGSTEAGPGAGLETKLADSALFWKDAALDVEHRTLFTAGALQMHTFRAHWGKCTSCARHQSTLVSAGADQMVCLWDISQRSRPKRIHQYRTRDPVTDVAIDSNIVLAASGSDISVWSRGTGKLLKRLGGHFQPVEAICYEDTDVLAACGNGTVHVFDLYSGATSQILSGGGDGAVVLSDFRASRQVAALLPAWHRAGWLGAVQLLAPHDMALAASASGEVFRWDLRTMRVAARLPRLQNAPAHMALVSAAAGLPIRPQLALLSRTPGELHVLALDSLAPARTLYQAASEACEPQTRGGSSASADSGANGRGSPGASVVGIGGRKKSMAAAGGEAAPWSEPRRPQSEVLCHGPKQDAAGDSSTAMMALAFGSGLTRVLAGWDSFVVCHKNGTVSVGGLACP